MSVDSGRHRSIRESIIKAIEEKGVSSYWTSHSTSGSIDFVRTTDNVPIHLSEPDVVLFKDDRTLIIEIELSNSPKALLGLALANAASDRGRLGRGRYKDLGEKSLLIVLDNPEDRLNKKDSLKPGQRKALLDLMTDRLGYKWVEIVLDADSVDAIERWLDAAD